VVIELTGGARLVSIITNTSLDSLGLQEGSQAYTVIKASNMMVAID
jgi:molybdopterin-binding protein